MGKKNVIKNYIYNLSYQILAIFIPLITTPYLSRVLGAENIGIYSYTLSIVTYFILSGSLGVALYGQKEIAYVQDDIEERSKKFYEIFAMKSITMILSLIVFYFVFCLNGKYNIYYSILILEMIANIIDVSWFFQGMEEFKKTVIRNMIVKILGLVLTLIFVKNSNDLVKYFWIYVITNFIGNLTLWSYLRKYIIKVNIKDLKIFKHLKPCIILFVPQIATQIYTVLDKTMIGTILNDISEVAYYEQSQKIVKVLLTLITAFGTVMLPRISNYFAKNDTKKIKESLNKSFNYASIMSVPLMFGIISVSDSLVPWFLGSGYEKAIIILKVISPIVLFISLTNVMGTQYLLPVKREKQYTIGVVTGAITNLIANFILISKFNSVGAAIATDIAEFAVLLVMGFFTRNDFEYKVIIKKLIKYCCFGLMMYICCYIVELLLSPSFICMIIQLIVGFFVYIILLLISKDEFIYNILNKLKEKY